ncbi:hypothetical protein [Actinacidiphila sp. bgisy160]|uniref:hypothetical protein n=1 Tax=Actinacidiphila sp. bgisy160 TaxID=3413796 RepID=UPI003D743819
MNPKHLRPGDEIHAARLADVLPDVIDQRPGSYENVTRVMWAVNDELTRRQQATVPLGVMVRLLRDAGWVVRKTTRDGRRSTYVFGLALSDAA